MGIQLRIMTAGVYWAADTNVPAFSPTLWGNNPDANAQNIGAGINCYSEDTHNLRFSRHEIGAGCTGDVSTNISDDADQISHLRVAYYANETAAALNQSLASAGGTILRTPTPYDGWEITAEDAARDECEWQIDMPAMIASGANITPGATVYVEAKLMFAPPLPINADGYVDPSYLRENPVLVDYDRLVTNDTIDWPEGTPPYFAQGQYWVNTLNTTLGPTIDGYDKANPIFHDCAWYSNNTGATCCPPSATRPAACEPYYAQDRNLIVDILADPTEDRFRGTGACLWKWKDLLCGECSECVCITPVGILCEGDVVTPDTTYCIMYPYVLFGYADWSSGIGLNRLCDPAEGNTPWVQITLTDCTGTPYTHREDPFDRCLGEAGYTVDQMISEWGWTPNADNDGRGQGWLKVTSNFPLDGYQFNMFNDGSMVFGAGVLAQSCWAGCVRGTAGTKVTK